MDILYICLDESGNLHHTSSDRFFLIGGFMTNNALKVRSLYKNSIKNYKEENKIDDTVEIKGSQINDLKKQEIILDIKNQMNKNNYFEECLIVVDKKNLYKQINETNILYNYFIKIMLENLYRNESIKNKEIILKVDNKTIKVGSLNSLNDYLVSEFYFKKTSIKKVMYEDSALKGEIQLADLICNYNWRQFKQKKIKDISNIPKNMFLFPKSTFFR